MLRKLIISCVLLMSVEPLFAKKGEDTDSNKPKTWKDKNGGLWRLLGDKKLGWDDSKATCDTLAEGSNARWRLPTAKEMQAAREEGISSSKNTVFGWIPLNNVWSIEWDSSLGESTANYLDFRDGLAYKASFKTQNTVLCVATTVKEANKVWSDAKTGAEWKYFDTKSSWLEAKSICEGEGLKQQMPWHLPEPNELVDAVSKGIQSPDNKTFGREFLAQTWSGKIYAAIDSHEAFAVDLRDASLTRANIEKKMSVVCVRSLSH